MARRDDSDPTDRHRAGPEGERFLDRWSRRKSAPEPAEPPASPEPDAPAGAPDQAAQDELIASLPDIDSLEAGSDFKPFLRQGVPEALKRRALRKLWRLNPVIASVDGLNDYDDDFTDAATVVEGLKTLFQARSGMRNEPAEAAHKARREAAEAEAAAKAEAETEASEAAPNEPPEVEVEVEAEAETETADSAPEAEAPAPPGSGRSALARRWGPPEA